MHFKPLGQKLPDNSTLFGRNLKYGAEAQRRSCSAIDKEYAVGTFTGRVFHIRRKTTTRYAGETEKVQLMRRKEEPAMIE